MHYGLIGNPLENTFSKNFFESVFKAQNLEGFTYNNFPLHDLSVLKQLIADKHLSGLNVTLPHKINVLPYMNELDESAQKTGAVNCIKVTGKTLKGYNTDVYGFYQSLLPLLQRWHQRALILGNGGAARAVKVALQQAGISWHTVTRQNIDNNLTGEYLSYEDVNEACIRSHQVIINTTPLGMFPNTSGMPDIPYSFMTEKHLAYDLIYLPETTRFLEMAANYGATTKNGLQMLHLQAERSWEVWNA
jgi:shikimate dehydrogenase